MKIGIDARFYGSLGKGLGRYTEKLIKYLEKIDHHNQYYILLRKENWQDYEPDQSNFKKILADYRWYSIKEQIMMPIIINKLGVDLMHFTHFNVPFFYAGNFVVTIHDLILTKYPTQRATTLGPLKYKLKHFGYKTIISSAIKRSKAVIAVSKYTKDEIIEHFSVAAKKIYVTHEGVDPLFIDNQDPNEVIKKYNVKKPYLLYVGNVYPHKNIEGLLSAFKIVSETKPELKLVLVGKHDYFFQQIKDLVKQKKLEDKVIFTGFVTDQDLPHLYKNAKLYCFSSFCEGFGLPALEALHSGLPVVASDNSCLPEVLSNAAIYFNPHDINQMAEKINYVLDNNSIAQELITRGYEQVKTFYWEKMAKATLDLYELKLV